jgi:DNA replication protein DnaC
MDIESRIELELATIVETDTPLIRAEMIAKKENIEGKTDEQVRRMYAERRVKRAADAAAEKFDRTTLFLKHRLGGIGVNTDGMTIDQMNAEIIRIDKADNDRREMVRREAVARTARQRSEIFFKQSGCPERHIANLGISAAGRWLEVLKLLSDQLKYADGFVVALLGARGTGKTQLAVTLIHRSCGIGLRCRYVKAGDIFRSIRATYAQVKRGDAQETEESIFDRWVSFDLLVIDESHERGETAAENQALVNIVDRRYDARRCTIFIGNQTKEDFAKSVGSSIISRIHECGEAIVCDWPSFRVPGTWKRGESAELRKLPGSE